MNRVWRQKKDYDAGPFGKQRGKNHFWVISYSESNSTQLNSLCGLIAWGMNLHEKYKGEVPKCKNCLRAMAK